MDINILSFGVAKDIVGGRKIMLKGETDWTIKDLKQRLFKDYPDLGRIRKLAIAVNDEYVSDDRTIVEKDEIILIPPVSGG